MRLSALGASAQELLGAFVTELEGIEGFVMPPGRYVGAGEIPWDGEGLYVYLGTTGVGQPGRPQSTNVPKVQSVFTTIAVYVMLVREVATFGYFSAGDPAPASDSVLNADGVRAFDDAGALIQAALAIKKAGDVVRNPQAGFVIGAVQPLGPSGGMAAVRLALELSVDQA